MKETCWNDCLADTSAKTASPDIKRAESLKETAKERISVIREIKQKPH